MLNEGLRSMECKSQVLEVTIPFIFSIEELFFFYNSIETFQDTPTMSSVVKKKKLKNGI